MGTGEMEGEGRGGQGIEGDFGRRGEEEGEGGGGNCVDESERPKIGDGGAGEDEGEGEGVGEGERAGKEEEGVLGEAETHGELVGMDDA